MFEDFLAESVRLFGGDRRNGQKSIGGEPCEQVHLGEHLDMSGGHGPSLLQNGRRGIHLGRLLRRLVLLQPHAQLEASSALTVEDHISASSAC